MVEPRFRRIATNRIRLNVAEAGPEDGPLVILLHGFPEFWYGWRHQIGPLAVAGYRVMAPDQRGYNRSDKPRGVASYRLEELVDDVLGLIDSAGRDRASVVGHDWGGIVAWAAIGRHPERFHRAAILNAPHPDAMLREVKQNPRQLLKSWYTFFFQIPILPERMFRSQQCRALIRGLERSSRPGTFTPGDLELYKLAWSEPGALTSMIHWYRAGFRHRPAPPDDPIVRVPTLILWGVKDRFIEPGLARSSFALCEDARIEWFDQATHWLQHEEPKPVNRLILDFLGEQPPGATNRDQPADLSAGPSGG
jgi:pimeloyl-ACP methyl ester carboxylesterase